MNREDKIDKYLKGDIYDIISKIDKRFGTPDKTIIDITGIRFYDEGSNVPSTGWKRPAHHKISYSWKGYTRGSYKEKMTDLTGESFEIKIDDGYGHCEVYNLVEQIREMKLNRLSLC
jgi:hypothetical protein